MSFSVDYEGVNWQYFSFSKSDFYSILVAQIQKYENIYKQNQVVWLKQQYCAMGQKSGHLKFGLAPPSQAPSDTVNLHKQPTKFPVLNIIHGMWLLNKRALV